VLDRARELSGLSVTRFAEFLGISQPVLSKYTGSRRLIPEPDSVEKFATRLETHGNAKIRELAKALREARKEDKAEQNARVEAEKEERARGKKPAASLPSTLNDRFSALIDKIGSDPAELGALYAILGNMIDSDWQIAKTLVMKAVLLAVKQSREADSLLNEPQQREPQKRAGSA
jgi:predicted transcriptional regulator